MTHYRQSRITLLSFWVSIACLGGCDLPGKPDRQHQPVPADKVADFDTLYHTRCAGCHGVNGNFGPAPPLNDPLFLAIIPDEALRKVVTEGRPGTPMPAFAQAHGGSLTTEQVAIIAEGIRTQWAGAGAKEHTPPAYLRNTANVAAFELAALQRGAAAYSRACADCHGTNGEGGFAGAIHDPAFLALISNQALRRIVITGRRDLGMPNYAERDGRADDYAPLTAEEIDDLVALLNSWRTRTGENVLATDTAEISHGPEREP